MQRLPRGVYTQEFREQAVQLVVEEKLSIPQASQRLSMSPKTLANGAGAACRGELAVLGGRQKPLTKGEEELRRLRRELVILRFQSLIGDLALRAVQPLTTPVQKLLLPAVNLIFVHAPLAGYLRHALALAQYRQHRR